MLNPKPALPVLSDFYPAKKYDHTDLFEDPQIIYNTLNYHQF